MFKTEISVIICAYTEKRWDALLGAVDSIQKQTLPHHEIIVVIDHNKTLFERTSKQFGNVILVLESHEVRGLSGARNTGIAVAKGNIIAFMDEDAVADSRWLENLYQAYQDSAVIGVGGMISPLWANEQPKWFPTEFNWVVGCTYRGVSEQTSSVRNLIGCNMSFRKDVFAKIGGFRPEIGRIGTTPLGCEETEFCIRAKQRFPHSQLIYLPDARVNHFVSPEREKFSYFRSRCYSEGISKSVVTALVGEQDGLSAERTYTFQTLPKGIIIGVLNTLRYNDFSELEKAGVIIIGLVITAWGYLVGKLISFWVKSRLIADLAQKL